MVWGGGACEDVHTHGYASTLFVSVAMAVWLGWQVDLHHLNTLSLVVRLAHFVGLHTHVTPTFSIEVQGVPAHASIGLYYCYRDGSDCGPLSHVHAASYDTHPSFLCVFVVALRLTASSDSICAGP